MIAPMCQYSAVDGSMTDWHLIPLRHPNYWLSGCLELRLDSGMAASFEWDPRKAADNYAKHRVTFNEA